MNTRGSRCDGRANDRLVYSPYYPPHVERAAPIKERCVDNAIRLDGQRRCARQPEVQNKLDVLGGPPVMAGEADVQVEHRLYLARQIGKMATRIDRQFLATSVVLSQNKSKPTVSVTSRGPHSAIFG